MQARKIILDIAVLWSRIGGESDGSNSQAPASAKVDAVGECKLEAEPATCFESDAKLALAILEEGLQLRIAFEASRHIAHR